MASRRFGKAFLTVRSKMSRSPRRKRISLLENEASQRRRLLAPPIPPTQLRRSVKRKKRQNSSRKHPQRQLRRRRLPASLRSEMLPTLPTPTKSNPPLGVVSSPLSSFLLRKPRSHFKSLRRSARRSHANLSLSRRACHHVRRRPSSYRV